LLLAGFLGGKTHFEGPDVDEVVKEFAHEAEVPSRPMAVQPGGAGDSGLGDISTPMPNTLAAATLDVDLSKLQLDPAAADTMSRQIGRLAGESRGDQLQRIERGLLRLERTNIQLLALMQQLVAAVKKPTGEGPK